MFLYAGTGMGEGVGAPFLIGAVCFLTLFWHSGQRWWIAAAGVALALAVASLYEAVPFGAAVFAAMAAGILWSSERRPSEPQGRGRAIEGLGLLLLAPSIFVGLLWIGANAVIMGDPLFFMNGAYGYSSYQADAFTSGGATAEGPFAAVAGLLAPRLWPFLIPLAFVLLARAVDGRLRRIESVSLLAIGLSVSVLLIVPMALLGSRMDFLRYGIYPLFAAAGWGLYEIAMSRGAAALRSPWCSRAGSLAIPACLLVMANPAPRRAGVSGAEGAGTGPRRARDGLRRSGRHAREARAYLDTRVVGRGPTACCSTPTRAPPSRPRSVRTHAKKLLMSFDRRFEAALADPVRHRVDYMVLPIRRPGRRTPSTGHGHGCGPVTSPASGW